MVVTMAAKFDGEACSASLKASEQVMEFTVTGLDQCS